MKMFKNLVMLLCLPGIVWAQAVNPIEDPEALDELPEPNTAYYQLLKSHRLKCIGEGSGLEIPIEITIGTKTFQNTGSELILKDADSKGEVTIGVTSATRPRRVTARMGAT